MTTPARIREAERASAAFQVALIQIGAETVTEALDLWQDVPAEVRPAQAASWLGKAIRLILTRRTQSRDLARAYFRLARALRTGRTTPDPRNPDPTNVPLSRLRYEFKLLAGESADLQQGDDEDDIPIDPEVDIESDVERQDREAEIQARITTAAVGPVGLAKKVAEIDTDKPASEVDVEREDAKAQAGARAASDIERLALNGARDYLAGATRKDPLCIGYIRLSRTGTPCGWCAMLISRGPVYKSEASAERAIFGDGEKYHTNCHCYAEPVYSDDEYETSPLYALNRKYEELWPQVTKGLSGKSALSAWRRFIREQQRAQAVRAQTQATQEA